VCVPAGLTRTEARGDVEFRGRFTRTPLQPGNKGCDTSVIEPHGAHERVDPRDLGADDSDIVAKLGDIAANAGLRRVAILAWRDLDDPESGGSEVHAANVAALWGRAGIEVTMRTSYAPGHPQVTWRDGYRVIRKAGRYMVFPRAAFSEMMGWHGASDGLVEIWNGMPFFSPVWARRPTVAWVHHVHDTMWEMTLPPRLARVGRTIEFRVAPPFYRRVPIVTLSESSKRELVGRLGFSPNRVDVVSPGIDARFSPGGAKSPDPLVLAVGRLVPVKRFPALFEALAACRARHPRLRAVVVGEGYEREALESLRREIGAERWIELPGWVPEGDLIALYRRAWVVASASAHEGWGMTLTEAAACGTPAVATRIAGHEDAVRDGETGLLADDGASFAAALDRVLADRALRDRLASAAVARAAELTWGATARGTLEVLAAEALRRSSS
jgi:glycosyltransferase involved in cell wall biosynthesis